MIKGNPLAVNGYVHTGIRSASNPLLLPKPLRKGDLIGLVAPSSPLPGSALELGMRSLSDRGYRVHAPKELFDSHRGYLAGKDSDRAKSLMDMFLNPEVRAIIAVRGGFGSQRILDKLDRWTIRSNPKIFLGYSDLTVLLLYLLDWCGVVPFHGSMVTDMGSISDDMEECLLKPLTHIGPLGAVHLKNAVWIRGGHAQGPLVGGNLSMLCATLGTPWEIRTEGRILLIEEYGEKPYRVDRMLHQLYMAGKLSVARGLVFGDIIERSHDSSRLITPSYETRILEILEDVTREFHGPVLSGLQSGHGNTNITLPFGVEVFMDAESDSFVFVESALEEP